MVALHSGVGQVVDVSLLESLFQIMGPLISLFGNITCGKVASKAMPMKEPIPATRSASCAPSRAMTSARSCA